MDRSQSTRKSRDKLLAAFEMLEFGVGLMRQNIARRMKGASQDQIDAELQRWISQQSSLFAEDQLQARKDHQS